MLKVAVARCAFVVLTLSTLAVSGADKTVTNEEHGFEITYPAEWNPITNSDGTVIGRISGAVVYVTPHVLQGKPSLAEWVRSRGLTATIMSTSEPYDLKLGGIDAYKVVRETPMWKHSHGSTQYFIVSGNRGYIISFGPGANDDKYAKYAKDIDAIVKSFKLIEAK